MNDKVNKLHKKILTNIEDKHDKSEGSFVYDVTKPFAIIENDLNIKLQEANLKRDINNLVNSELDNFINDRTPLKRKLATKASGYATFKGKEGLSIPLGFLISTDSISYITKESKPIGNSGKTDILVECLEVGELGNVPAMAINQVSTTLSGLDEVYNKKPFINGYDEESDDAFRERYRDYIDKPITSNNIYHYEMWAMRIDGVGAVKVIPCWDGPNSTKLIIMDSKNEIPSKDLIEKVQNYIDPLGEFQNGRYSTWGQGRGVASAGAFVTVVGAKSKEIDISANVDILDNYDKDKIKKDFTNRVKEHLKSIAFKNEGISLAKIGCILLNTPGVNDYYDLKLNNDINNIEVSDEEIAVVGEVVFNE